MEQLANERPHAAYGPPAGGATGDPGTGAGAGAGAPRHGPPHVVDDYRLRGRLSRSAAADAFLATHRRRGDLRVLYVLRTMAMQDRALVERVVREVDVARRLRHPAFPAVDPFGETAEGRLYVAVEHRPGRSLDALVAEGRALDHQWLVRVIRCVMDALDEAHAAGLVHGRLTPKRITMTPAAWGRDVAINVTGMGFGLLEGPVLSPEDLPYRSPEHSPGSTVDPRADAFSLAAVLKFVMDGAPPPPAAGALGLDDVPALENALLAALVRERGIARLRRAPARRAAPSPPAADRTDPFLIDVGPAHVPVAADQATTAPWVELTDLASDAPAHGPAGVEPHAAYAAPRFRIVGVPSDRRPARRAAVALAAVGLLVGAAGFLRATGDPDAGAGRVAAPHDGTARDGTARDGTARDGAARDGAPRGAARPAAATRRVGSAQGVLGPTLRAAVSSVASSRAAPAATVATRPSGPAAAPDDGHVSVSRDAAAAGDSAPASARQLDVALPQVAVSIPEVKLASPPTGGDAIVHAGDFAPATEAWRRDYFGSGPPPSRPADPAEVAAARQAAQRAADAFARAVATRDIAALQRVAPDMSAKERARWEKVFRGARRVGIQLTVGEVRLDGDVVSAAVQSRVEVWLPGSGTPVRSNASSTMTLVRDSSEWRIQTVP